MDKRLIFLWRMGLEMCDFLLNISYVLITILAVWWIALSICMIADSLRRKRLPPPTEEQINELTRFQKRLDDGKVELAFYSRFSNPNKCMKLILFILIHLPFAVLLFPVIIVVGFERLAKKINR